MTNFEEKLSNLRDNLASEQCAFEQERWAQIEATELAQFKQEQERICAEGISALQTQKNASIAQKIDELKTKLKNEVLVAFSTIDRALLEAQNSIPKLG